MIALTFDDGQINRLLELAILKKYNAKATFFMVGKNVSANPDIANRTRKVINREPYLGSSSSCQKLSLDNAKRSWMPRSYSKATGVQTKIAVLRMEPSIVPSNTVSTNRFIMWDIG